jgi:Rho-binding antiterminator
MTDYTPVECGIYSEYELAILHGKRLRICWRSADGQPRMEVLTPRDLRTRDHAEYLLAERHGGQLLALRLDYISKVVAI